MDMSKRLFLIFIWWLYPNSHMNSALFYIKYYPFHNCCPDSRRKNDCNTSSCLTETFIKLSKKQKIKLFHEKKRRKFSNHMKKYIGRRRSNVQINKNNATDNQLKIQQISITFRIWRKKKNTYMKIYCAKFSIHRGNQSSAVSVLHYNVNNRHYLCY